MDMLIASTADALIDSLYSFNHIRATEVKFKSLYDTTVYILTNNIMERPSVKFFQDTLSIVIWSSYLQWGNYHKGEWHSNGWYIGKSDWIVCKYIYSKTEERWVMVESDFGGI